MKIIKTTLGWEVQPQTSDEQYRLTWFIDWAKSIGQPVTIRVLLRLAKAISPTLREALLSSDLHFADSAEK